jgi:hypothetical protein
VIKVRTGGRGWEGEIFYQKIDSNRPQSVVFDNRELKFKASMIFHALKILLL